MYKPLTSVVLLTLVSACSSSLDRRHANGDDDYVNSATSPILTIPAPLKAPNYSKEFDIPSLSDTANTTLVGMALDIRPPLQILPMAEGTHVEEGTDTIKVVVESIDNSVDLKQEIYDTLKDYLVRKGIGIAAEDYEAGTIDTDWIENNEVLDTSLWGNDKVYTLKQRYRFDVQVRPHGRTGSLVISLIDHQESFDGDIKNIELTAADKQRYTIDMLNSAVAYLSLKRNDAMQAKRIEQSQGIEVGLVESEHDYFLAKAPYDRVWERLRIVLPEMGFEIVDLDPAKSLFFVNFNDESGFWSSLWGDSQLPLKKGSYRIKLAGGSDTNETVIKLSDIADEPLDNDIIKQVYDAFSDLMSEKRKVR
ncbi:outer membrane protein assembly factor BamC [Shewanella sp. NIFS-20-20]|uniref:outer membrane protein assembly factor BamC n=1 Tax=Shewanella sp. NIFS-20-20 TaxID=2853806 RepID=UPI001C43BA86|nr:outer membrane protein assembly factor BamC [Shewanella sp. NIFS-20-20]MBV7317021.1 outer membrane protein assembly factor BamC [Shewanella sp. NIFS-20-20]